MLAAVGMVLTAGVAVAVQRQIAGYFATSAHHARAGVRIASAARPQPAGSDYLEPNPTVTGARLAIIIDDCGYDPARENKFLDMPVPMTMAVLPMSPHGREFAEAAQSAGKDVILHLPMEPKSSQFKPGPGAITTAMSDDDVKRQVELDLEALPPVRGMNNHMGSRATQDARIMRDVIDTVKGDGLFWIDSETVAGSLGATFARESSVPTAVRDVFLDNDNDVVAVRRQLRLAARLALARGAAIAIGHPKDATIEVVSELIPELQEAGITFVFAADLVK